MASNIYLFLVYAFSAVTVFYCLPEKYRKYWLSVVSLLFYILCDLRYFLLTVAETGAGFFIGKKIGQAVKDENKKAAKRYLVSGVAGVAGILVLFKYYGFFARSFSFLPSKLLLPLGISYYSFKILSYLIDIYWKKRESGEFWCYAAYILFFPQLLCGPIVRSERMMEQIEAGPVYSGDMCAQGCVLILSGLFKKVVIADRLAGYVDTVFADPAGYPSLALLMGAVFFSVQLYCDFAGYSEIAAGVTGLFGLKCEKNFARPYLARNVREFWRRWHISLSSWLRDYIYIPLGGSRVSRVKRARNVMITFLACGMWHGGQMHFLLWGMYHGLLNIMAFKASEGNRIKQIAAWLGTLVLVVIGWVFFRAESMGDAFRYLWLLVSDFSIRYHEIADSVIIFTGNNTSISSIMILFVLAALLFVKEYLEEYKKKGYDSLLWSGIFFFGIVMFGFTGNSSFLYANF